MGTRVQGKVAIVTGAARGQGASHSEALAEEGAHVLLTDVRDELGDKVAAAIEARGGVARYVHLDVTKASDWEAAVRTAEDLFGKVDVLVNNAGIGGLDMGAVDCTDEEWSRVIAVNQTGVFYGMRATIPAMRRAGHGSIVNIASISGAVRGTRGYLPYDVSKAAVAAMTRNAALSHGHEGIRANAIAPGPVDTPMLAEEIEELKDSPSPIAARVKAQPIQRIAAPKEVSAGVVFLASEESSYMTGTILVIDGGRTI